MKYPSIRIVRPPDQGNTHFWVRAECGEKTLIAYADPEAGLKIQQFWHNHGHCCQDMACFHIVDSQLPGLPPGTITIGEPAE